MMPEAELSELEEPMEEEEKTTLRRKGHPLPRWVRVGDGIAELVLVIILVGGFFSEGYAVNQMARGLAWFGCSLLGGWAAIGFSAGRWKGEKMRTARIGIALFTVVILWTGFQLIPVSSNWVTRVNPVWAEIQSSFVSAGLTFPEKISLALSPVKGLASWTELVAAAMFFAGVSLLATRRSSSVRIFFYIGLGCLAEGLWGVLSYALGGSRAMGAIYNPNHHAALVAMGLPIYFSRLVQWKRSSPALQDTAIVSGSNPLLLFFGCGLIAIIGWLTSLSRGSLVLAGAVLVLWLVIEIWGGWRDMVSERKFEITPGIAIAGVAGLVILVLSLAGLILTASVFQGFSARGGLEGEIQGRGRLDIWEAALHGLARTPWTGLGLSGTENAINQFSLLPMAAVPIWAHNDYLQMLVELGIPAMVLAVIVLMTFIVSMSRDWMRRVRDTPWSQGLMQRAALAGVLATLAHSITDFHLRIPLVGLTFLTLLALAVNEGALIISPRMYAHLFYWPLLTKPLRRMRSSDS